MTDEKVLNLSDVEIEDFEAIERAIEDWKSSGLSGCFTFVSDEEFQEVFNKGVWRGGFALAGGILTGTLIYYTIEHFKTKKKKLK